MPLLGAVSGLGFATKGPVALLVPGLAVLLLMWESRRRPIPCSWGALALGVLAFAVLGLGWFVLVYRQMGTAPLVAFFFRENLERFAGEAYDVGRPFWFYPPAYLAEGLPWSAFLPVALWRLLRSADGDEARGARFLTTWAALVLVPLSLSRGKIDYYLLPLYPAVSLVIGRYLARAPWQRADRAWAGVVLACQAAVLVLLLAMPPRIPDAWLPGALPRALLLLVAAAGAALLVAVAVRPTPRRAAVVLASLVAAAWLVVVAWFLPAFASAQPNRAIVADVARERSFRSDLRMAFCSDPTRVRRDVLLHVRLAAFSECDLWSLAGSREPFLLLATPAQDASFRADPRYREVARYRYLPASALTIGGCSRSATRVRWCSARTSRRTTRRPSASASARTAGRSGGGRRGRRLRSRARRPRRNDRRNPSRWPTQVSHGLRAREIRELVGAGARRCRKHPPALSASRAGRRRLVHSGRPELSLTPSTARP